MSCNVDGGEQDESWKMQSLGKGRGESKDGGRKGHGQRRVVEVLSRKSAESLTAWVAGDAAVVIKFGVNYVMVRL